MEAVGKHSHSHSTFYSNLDTKQKPKVSFDPRCEYDVPMFADISREEVTDISERQKVEFVNWFSVPHDFKVSRKVTPQMIK
jgi:hypothetical protein